MELDLNHLTEGERDAILAVLSRNDVVRQRDVERIRTLKAELKEIRLKGVIKAGQNAEKTCARCRTSFGWFANKGSLCPKCQHKVCDNCQKPTKNGGWLCALCHKQMEYDAMSNDWFNSKHRKSKRNPKTNEVVSGSELVRSSIRRTDTDSVSKRAPCERVRRALMNNNNTINGHKPYKPPRTPEAECSDTQSMGQRSPRESHSESHQTAFPEEEDEKYLQALITGGKVVKKPGLTPKELSQHSEEMRRVNSRQQLDPNSSTDTGSDPSSPRYSSRNESVFTRSDSVRSSMKSISIVSSDGGITMVTDTVSDLDYPISDTPISQMSPATSLPILNGSHTDPMSQEFERSLERQTHSTSSSSSSSSSDTDEFTEEKLTKIKFKRVSAKKKSTNSGSVSHDPRNLADSTSNSDVIYRRAESMLDTSYDADMSQHSSMESITNLERYNREFASQPIGDNQLEDKDELDYLVELNTIEKSSPEDHKTEDVLSSTSSSSSSSSLVIHEDSVCSSESGVYFAKPMSSDSDTPIRSKVDILLSRFGHKPRDKNRSFGQVSNAPPDVVPSSDGTLSGGGSQDKIRIHQEFDIPISAWSNKGENAREDLEWDNMVQDRGTDVTDSSIDRSRLYVTREITDRPLQSRHVQDLKDLRFVIRSISPMDDDDDDDDSLSVISERTEPDSDDDDTDHVDNEEDKTSDFSVDSDVYISTDDVQENKSKLESSDNLTEQSDTPVTAEVPQSDVAKNSKRDVFGEDELPPDIILLGTTDPPSEGGDCTTSEVEVFYVPYEFSDTRPRLDTLDMLVEAQESNVEFDGNIDSVFEKNSAVDERQLSTETTEQSKDIYDVVMAGNLRDDSNEFGTMQYTFSDDISACIEKTEVNEEPSLEVEAKISKPLTDPARDGSQTKRTGSVSYNRESSFDVLAKEQATLLESSHADIEGIIEHNQGLDSVSTPELANFPEQAGSEEPGLAVNVETCTTTADIAPVEEDLAPAIVSHVQCISPEHIIDDPSSLVSSTDSAAESASSVDTVKYLDRQNLEDLEDEIVQLTCLSKYSEKGTKRTDDNENSQEGVSSLEEDSGSLMADITHDKEQFIGIEPSQDFSSSDKIPRQGPESSSGLDETFVIKRPKDESINNSSKDVFITTQTGASGETAGDLPMSEQKEENGPSRNTHDTSSVELQTLLSMEENTEIQAIAELETDKDLSLTRKRLPTSDLDDDLEDIVEQNKDFMSDEELEDIMKDITRSKIAKLRAESQESVNVFEDEGVLPPMRHLHSASSLTDDVEEEAFMKSLTTKRVSFSDVTIISSDEMTSSQILLPEDGATTPTRQSNENFLISSSDTWIDLPFESKFDTTDEIRPEEVESQLGAGPSDSVQSDDISGPPTSDSVEVPAMVENGDVMHESVQAIAEKATHLETVPEQASPVHGSEVRDGEMDEHLPAEGVYPADEAEIQVSDEVREIADRPDGVKQATEVKQERGVDLGDEIEVVEHIEEPAAISKKEEKEMKAAAKRKEKEEKEAAKKLEKEKAEAAKRQAKEEKEAVKRLQKEAKLAAKAKEKEEKEMGKKNKTGNAQVADVSTSAEGTLSSKDAAQTPIAAESLGADKVVDEVSLTEDQLDAPRAVVPAIVTTKDTPSKTSSASYTTAQDDRASRSSASSEKDDNIEEIFAAHSMGNRSNLLSPYSISRDSLASYYSDAGEANYGKIAVKGDIKFGLDYNYKAACLEISVCECRDLAAVDTKKKRSDPYVKAYLLPDKSKTGKRKTRVKKNTLNPQFNEVIKFHVAKSELETRTLWVAVWNNDVLGRNDFLGEVTISLDYYHFTSAEPKWYQLQQRVAATSFPSLTYKGDLDVSVKYVTPANVTTSKGKKTKGGRGELQVLVKKAQNLTAVRSNGTSNPFCKGYLLPDKATKVKTPVIKHTCNPEWNHTFVFESIIEERLVDFCLELTVWDHDRLTSNDFLGGVRISLGQGISQGKEADWMDSQGREIELWQSVLDRPDQWVDASLPLRTNMAPGRK